MFLRNWCNKVNTRHRDVNHRERIPIKEVKLPLQVEYLKEDEVTELVKSMFNGYKALNYNRKTKEELEEKEWSSWEIAILLRFYKYNLVFNVPDPEDIFPPFVFDYDDILLKNEINKIIHAYTRKEKIGFTEQRLRKDVYWTPIDITHLLYFLATYIKDEEAP